MTIALKQIPTKGSITMTHLFHLERSTVKMLLVLSLPYMKVYFHFLIVLRNSHATSCSLPFLAFYTDKS